MGSNVELFHSENISSDMGAVPTEGTPSTVVDEDTGMVTHSVHMDSNSISVGGGVEYGWTVENTGDTPVEFMGILIYGSDNNGPWRTTFQYGERHESGFPRAFLGRMGLTVPGGGGRVTEQHKLPVPYRLDPGETLAFYLSSGNIGSVGSNVKHQVTLQFKVVDDSRI